MLWWPRVLLFPEISEKRKKKRGIMWRVFGRSAWEGSYLGWGWGEGEFVEGAELDVCRPLTMFRIGSGTCVLCVVRRRVTLVCHELKYFEGSREAGRIVCQIPWRSVVLYHACCYCFFLCYKRKETSRVGRIWNSM